MCFDVKSDDFCDSYLKNNRKVIVFKKQNQQNLLIIDNNYWNLEEKDKDVSIVSADRVPNSSPLLSNDYSFAVRNYVKVKSNEGPLKGYYGIAFYKVLNEPFNEKKT